MIIRTKYGEMIITEGIAKRMQNLLEHIETTPENLSFASELLSEINKALKKSKYGKVYYHGYVIIIKDAYLYDFTEHHYYEIYKCRDLVYDSKDYVKTLVGTLEYVLSYIDAYLI